MATEVGAAYVRLLPSMRGFTAAARDGLKSSLETAGRDAGAKGGEAAGKGFMGSFTKRISGAGSVIARTVGKGAKALGVASVAAAGLVGTLGVKRLIGLENANKALKQMGLGTKQIDGLMASLLKTLKGTPFALNEGAGAMAALVSAGAPLKRVPAIMDMLADSAAFAQKPLSEVGRVFQKIQSQGKIQGDEIMSLAEMGLPAFQIMSKGIGKSVEETQKIVTSGKFTAEQFFAAWEKGSKGFGAQNIKIAGAAKSAGDTTQGAFANMRAAAGRLGETLLGRPFASTKNFFNTVTTLIDNANTKLKPFVDKFYDLAGAAGSKLKPIVLDITADAKGFVDGIDWAGIGNGIQEKSKSLGAPFISGWQSGVETGNWANFGKALGDGLGKTVEGLTTGGAELGSAIGKMLASLDWFDIGKGVGKGAISLIVGFAVGLLNTDLVGILGKLWENKWGTALGILMLIPVGRGLGLLSKGLAKIPFLKVFAPLVGLVGKGMEKFGGLIFKGIGKLGGKFGQAFTRAFPRAGGFIEKIFGDMARKGNEKMNQFAIAIVTKVRGLPGKLGTLAGKFVDKGFDLIFAFAKGMGRGVLKVGKIALGIPAKIVSILTTLYGTAYQFGWDTITGFINGIIDKAKDIPGAIKEHVVSGVNKFLPKKLELGSPSKLTKKYGEWVAQGFANGLREGSDSIRDSMRDIMTNLKSDVKKGALPAAFLKQVTKMRANLIKRSNKRDAILDQLEAAKDKLQEIKDEAKGFAQGIRDTFKATGDASQFEAKNFTELAGFMKNARDNVATFTSTMEALQGLGLNESTMRQLLEAGPEAGLKNAQLILSEGKAGVDQINGLMAGIQQQGDKLAGGMTNAFYAAGIASADAIVQGLKTKKSALDEAIKELAQRLVKTLKQELKIKSPSKVFESLGTQVPAGFAGGITSGTPEVLNSLRRMIMTPENVGSYAASLPNVAGQFSGAGPLYSTANNGKVESTKVLISADGLNRYLLMWLREEIRVQGGNVQKVLGKGNGN